LNLLFKTAFTTIIGAMLYGTYVIYINVSFSLPQQIADMNKGIDLIRQQSVDNKLENKEQHVSFVYRDDKIIDKLNENYSVLLKNIYEIKQKLKMAIDYNEILKKQQGLTNGFIMKVPCIISDTTNILIVKK
jgi:hypothetical protein